MSEFFDKLKEYAAYTEEGLDSIMPKRDNYQKVIYDAMRYSLLGGGKRIRPVLSLVTAELFGLDREMVKPFALAIELIHTSSLIHDDLPAMDNDDYRRGRLSCHKRFDEATAILAGDALLTYAFEVAGDGASSIITKAVVSGNEELARNASKVVGLLAARVGAEGMIGGQIIDLKAEDTAIDEYEHDTLCRLKTGCLMTVPAEISGLLAGKKETPEYVLLLDYSKSVGLAFQIRDDILDVEGDPNLLGKKTGMDDADNKTTFVTLYGIDGARHKLEELTSKAIADCRALMELDGCRKESAQFLIDLAGFLLERKY
ncbi:MAG: polyprenyl synthetase family protein [Clostridia bacterium]|nr:polyprenyl synthetase family protein [Clostridia bacterium]